MFNFFQRKPSKPMYPSCVFYCLKEECPLWVILIQNFKDKGPLPQGKCAIAWLPTLMIELKQAILLKKKKG